MKQIHILFIIALGFCAISCDNRTSAQSAQDSLEKEMRQHESDMMRREKWRDSLVDVAAGLHGKYQTANRQHALDILKKEYPSVDWSDIQNDIYASR